MSDENEESGSEAITFLRTKRTFLMAGIHSPQKSDKTSTKSIRRGHASVNQKLRQNPERYMAFFRQCMPRVTHHAHSGIALILGKQLMLKYNYGGDKNNEIFRTTPLNKCLRKAWFENNEVQHRQSMQAQFGNAHNRIWVHNFRARQAEQARLAAEAARLAEEVLEAQQAKGDEAEGDETEGDETEGDTVE
ncbi:hypothetical protein DMENIID0001_138080 [Sergentomyia squamirostris]